LERSLEEDRNFIELLSTIDRYHQRRNRASYESRKRRAQMLASGAGKM
jgi:hypothetical protein